MWAPAAARSRAMGTSPEYAAQQAILLAKLCSMWCVVYEIYGLGRTDMHPHQLLGY